MDEKECQRQFDEALKAGSDRNYERAIELLLDVASTCDDFPQAHLYLGRSFHAVGNHGLAIQAYQDFLRLSPDDAAGHFFLGRTYLSAELYENAASALKRSADLDPGNPIPKSLLGLACLRLKRSDLAVKYLSEAVELDPSNTKVHTGYLNALLTDAVRRFHAGDQDMAQQMFEFLVQAGVGGVLPHLHLAIIARDTGDYATAEKHYAVALKSDPDNAVIRFQLASVLFSTGKTDQAISLLSGIDIVDDAKSFSFQSEHVNRIIAFRHYHDGKYRDAAYFAKEVIKAKGSDPELHLLMGDSYRQLGASDRAENHFRRAIELAPENLEARYGLAVTLWECGEFEDLLAVLRQIKRLDPGNSEADYYAALAQCELDFPPEETIKAIRSVLRSHGPDAHLLSALGNQYIVGDLTELAPKWYEKALELSPDNHAALYGLIRAYGEIGPLDQARAAFRNYLDVFDGDAEVRRSYIDFLVEAGDYQDASLQIERYIPGSGYRHYRRTLAMCYRETERFSEAASLYKMLLRDDPSNESFLRSLVYCLERSGQRSYAVNLLSKAIGYLNPTPTIILILGVLLYKSGKLEEALKNFKKAAKMDPADWRAPANIGKIYADQGLDAYANRYASKAESLKPGGGIAR